jgi:hypothetical protein
MRKKLFQMMV